MNRKPQILLVVPNYNDSVSPDYNYFPPLGLGYVSSALQNAEYAPVVLNLNHLNGKTPELLRRELDRVHYDIVCTGGNSLIYDELYSIIRTTSHHQSAPVTVLGGPIVTTEPVLIFEAIEPDYGVIGDGEKTVTELVSHIMEPNNDISGTIFRRSGETVLAPPREPALDLDTINFPDLDALGYADWLDHQPTNFVASSTEIDNPRPYPIMGSRDCPFKCTFCFHFSKYRERSMENLFSELEAAVVKYKINLVLLADECFSLKPARMHDFCLRITELRKRLNWDLKWSIQLTVKHVDEALLNTLKDAGCNSVSYGFESFSPVVLKSMNKPITPEEIDNALRRTLDANLIVIGNFIFGDTKETPQTVNETLTYWRNHCESQVSIGLIQLYPGSEIYKRSVDKGIIKDRLSFIRRNIAGITAVNFTEAMSNEEFEAMLVNIYTVRCRYSKFAIINKIHKKQNGYYRITLKCPFCKKRVTYDNVLMQGPPQGILKKMPFLREAMLNCRQCSRRFWAVPPLMRVIYKLLGFKPVFLSLVKAGLLKKIS